jgi:hypothetical protein
MFSWALALLFLSTLLPWNAYGRLGSEAAPLFEGCAALPDTEAGEAPASGPDSGLPDGLDLDVLAEYVWESPSEDQLVLTLLHITLHPQAQTGVLRTEGPTVYYVISGTVFDAFAPDGQPLDAGDAHVLERRINYEFENRSPDEPAVYLRLALEPSGKQVMVGRGDPSETLGQDRLLEPPYESLQLFSAPVPVPEGDTRLALGCLGWSDPEATTGELACAGPLGVYIASGAVATGSEGAGLLETGFGGVYEPGSTPTLAAVDGEPAAVLMAGLLPADSPWWVDPSVDD